MKVLIIIPGEEHGSSMIFAKNQVKDLQKAGVSCSVFYLRSRTNPSVLIEDFFRLRDQIKIERPDVLHCHYGSVTSFTAAISNIVPLVITFHGSDINRASGVGFWRGFFGRLLSQLSILRAKKVICVSSRLKDQLWWGREKAVIIPMGIDATVFVPMDQNTCKQKLSLDPQKKYIFFNGSNPEIKRNDIAKAIEAEVKKVVPTAELLVLKGGVDPDEIPLYLNSCDCLLLCSDTEGSPMVIKEALSCELPIVSSDVGDVRERISGVRNSYVIERNVALMAQYIVDVLKNGGRSDGRKKIDEFSSALISQRIASIYKEILI